MSTSGFSQSSNVSDKQTQNDGPIPEHRLAESAVRDANKDQDVRNAIGEFVGDFARGTGLAGMQGDHSVEHVQVESHKAKESSGDQ